MSSLFRDDERDEEILRANELVEKGEELKTEGNTTGSIQLMLKALNIYLGIGAYLKMTEIFNLLTSSVKTESEILRIIEELRETIATMEYLDLPEEIAKLKMVLANLTYRSGNFLLAGNLFIEVADLFNEVDPEEYRQVSGMFLLRAGECFEKISRTERGENLILEAIKRFDTNIFDLNAAKRNLKVQINKTKKFELAIDTIQEIAEFFRRMEEQLEHTLDNTETFENLKQNVTSRLLHTISEYNLLKMICFKNLDDEDSVKKQAEKSLKDLTKAIELTKEEIKSGNYSNSDIVRIAFDMFTLQFFQEFANYQVEDPIDLVIRGLNKDVIKEIKDINYFQDTEHVLEADLYNCEDIVEEMDLSAVLKPFRAFILKSLRLIK